MCLGVPGKVVRWIRRDGPLAQAEVEFGGVRRLCHMACTIDANEGDYVIVHAGVAIQKVDSEAAERLLDELAQMGEDDAWSTT